MAGGPYKHGDGWQVKWRHGGRWQTEVLLLRESVVDEAGITVFGADDFKAMVEAAGNDWPVDDRGHRWIKGFGFPPHDPEPESRTTPFLDYAKGYVQARLMAGKISEHTAAKYLQYAQTIAGSLVVSPELYERVHSDEELAMRVAVDPMAARELLLSMVGSRTDEELSEASQHVVVEDIDREAIRTLFMWQRARPKYAHRPDSPGIAWKTIKNYHGFLHGILEQAYYDDLIPKNPCKITKNEIGREATRKRISLEPAEFWLLHSCIDSRFQDFMEVAVGTGCRFGELTASRVKDWDPKERCLRVEEAWKRGLKSRYYRGKPKTAAGEREIFVGSRVAELLSRAAEGKAPDDLLFTAVQGGYLRQNSFYEERWQPAVREAVARGLSQKGVPIYPRFHDLRHTHIYWLRRGGLRNELIKTLVGHSDEAMTEQYGHVPVEVKRAAGLAIDEPLRRLRSAS